MDRRIIWLDYLPVEPGPSVPQGYFHLCIISIRPGRLVRRLLGISEIPAPRRLRQESHNLSQPGLYSIQEKQKYPWDKFKCFFLKKICVSVCPWKCVLLWVPMESRDDASPGAVYKQLSHPTRVLRIELRSPGKLMHVLNH